MTKEQLEAAKINKLELKSCKYYLDQGYQIMHSSGSRTCWDLIAYDGYEVIFVQCKKDHLPSTEELKRMDESRVPPNGRKVIHHWRKNAHHPEVISLSVLLGKRAARKSKTKVSSTAPEGSEECES